MQESSEQAAALPQSPCKTVPIWSLSDDLLSMLFTYVSPKDRFELAEVCTRWASVSRTNWTDVIQLDLSPISPENIGPIIRLCPKLQWITAQDCELNVKSVAENCRGELKSLRLYRVSANTGVPAAPQDTVDSLCEAVINELQSLPSLEELVLHDLRLGDLEFEGFFAYSPFIQLPGSLKRLQLNNRALVGDSVRDRPTFAGLSCLILEDGLHRTLGPFTRRSMEYLMWLPQLRELYLGSLLGRFIRQDAGPAFVRSLARLEVLCLDTSRANVSKLATLFTSRGALRILVITGVIGADAGETLVPPRRRYPNGFGSDPLPLLHVFVGGQIAQKIRFSKSPNDAMEIHPITLPMPQFLEQPEVAAIFKGSWIAEMIKKGAKSNARLWDYEGRTARSFLVL